MAGITADGLTVKTLLEIKGEIEADEHADINASLDVSDETFIGQLNTIYADQMAQAYEALVQVYASAYRASAVGVQLDYIGALTGTLRLAAVKSTVNVVAVGTLATVLPISRVVSVAGASASRFTSLAAATIAAVPARAVTTIYAVGALATNDGGKIYYCKIGGTSSAGAGPTGTTNTIVDGSVTWAYVALGSAAVVIPVQAENFGATVAVANTMTTIETPVTGWTSVANPVDAALGRLREEDESYRIRQEQSLTITGAASPDAIRADVLKVSGVTGATVFENPTSVTNVDGLPPHSFEVLVLGGTDQDIANKIWSTKPAGIYTFGSLVLTVVDGSGSNQTVRFSRPTELPFYVTVGVTYDPKTFPVDGAAQIKQALITFWSTKTVGDDVVRSQLFAPIDAIAGTYDTTSLTLGFAAAPVGIVNLPVTTRQLATLAVANIVVNLTSL